MSLRMLLTHWLESVWYGSRPLERSLLYPLSLLFCWLAQRRRRRLAQEQQPLPVPVIVVGNISVGGTGKTPLVVWLVGCLQAAGYRPGVVSRGVGRRAASPVRAVAEDDPPAEVGDEPLLIVQRTGVPLVVGRGRVEAIRHLLREYACDVVVSDDGLQHYRMPRAIEIAVLDGGRRFGNGLCLPAGPLREKPERLHECDFVVANGRAGAGEFAMQVDGHTLRHLRDGRTMPLAALAGQTVQVVTAIGHPGRFLATLGQAGIRCVPQVFPDHHLFTATEVRREAGVPVLMTEKDAVKCRQFAGDVLENVWYLPVEARFDNEFGALLLKKLQGCIANGQKTARHTGLPSD